MFDILHAHIKKRIAITPEEFDRCTQFFTPRKIAKRRFLLQAGGVCKHFAFVNSGLLREYSVDQKGEEHIIQFAIKDWWVSDLNSYLSGMPSMHNIDAMQDSEVLLLEKAARDKLLEAVPIMDRFFRILLEANYVATHKRVNETLSASAEERYLTFVQKYPQIVEQVPQNLIASYLGITPQSLSRIRKRLSPKR